jgi:hypothetical protein
VYLINQKTIIKTDKMKTIAYKTGNVMKSIVASLIVLASFAGISKGENSNKEANSIVVYNAQEYVEAELSVETANWMNSDSEIDYKVAELAYNAKDFVAAELAAETESWMNSNGETSDEIALQVAQYNPMEFAEADFAREAESWISKTARGNQSVKGTNYNNELANN